MDVESDGAPGALLVRVAGPCMAPALREGDVEPALPASDYRAGDVAVIGRGADLLVHRLVARVAAGRRVWWVHQGDGSREAGLAADDEVCARLLRPRRVVRRSAPASLLWLAAQAGAQWAYAGAPVPAAARRAWKALLRGARSTR